MLTRSIPWELKSISETGEFEGWASVYGVVDSQGDIVERGAFADTLRESPEVVLLNQHDTRQPIGLGKLEDAAYGLKLLGRLNLDVAAAREAYSNLKKRILKGLSIGFMIPEGGERWDSLGRLRRLLKIKLYEVSLVTFPANPMATVTGVKSVLSISEVQSAYENCRRAMQPKSIEAALTAFKAGRADIQKAVRDAVRAIGDGPHFYREIDEREVDRHVRDSAVIQLLANAKELGLTGVRIRWFKPCSRETATFSTKYAITGQTREFTRDAVWIRADVRTDEAMRSVAHEMRHLADYRAGMRPTADEAAWERRAREFEFRTAPRV
jgi:HK97 family phage prohead protease